MSVRMSEGEACAFVAEGTRTGKLATVRADGRPRASRVLLMSIFDSKCHLTTRRAARA